MAADITNTPPERPPSSHLTTSPYQAPQLRYFISRNNGTIVPLLPADELPYNIRLEGVQRVMKMENASGMTLVGTLPFTGRFFKLDTNPSQRPTADIADKPIAPPSATATTWRRKDDSPKEATQAKIDTIVASEANKPASGSDKPSKPSSSSSSRSTPESGEKVYCTHWIRHGECDYTQQGCRYKHEMPDKATLAGIGFRTIPRWWQEKVAVQLGQSTIPTAGPVVKPEEWLKQRRSSSGSASESSDSDSEVESDDEKNLITAKPDLPLPSQEEKEKASSACTESAKAPVSIDATTSKTSNQAVSDLKPDTPSKARQLSQTEDLIDLASPTLSTQALSSDNAISLPPKPSPPTKPPKHDQTTTIPPPLTTPRKVFVPHGESREHHIAESRKHAVLETQTSGNSGFYRFRGNLHKIDTRPDERFLPIHSTAAPRNTQNLKRPDIRGLMASKHAPTMTAARVSAIASERAPTTSQGEAAIDSRPSTSIRVQKSTHNRSNERPASSSSSCSSPSSSGKTARPTSKPTRPPTLTPSPSPTSDEEENQAQATATAKSLTKPSPTNKEKNKTKTKTKTEKVEATPSSPPNACRPRRPKGQSRL